MSRPCLTRPYNRLTVRVAQMSYCHYLWPTERRWILNKDCRWGNYLTPVEPHVHLKHGPSILNIILAVADMLKDSRRGRRCSEKSSCSPKDRATSTLMNAFGPWSPIAQSLEPPKPTTLNKPCEALLQKMPKNNELCTAYSLHLEILGLGSAQIQ